MTHTLKADGAPFYYDTEVEEYRPVNEGKSTAGHGGAVCSCGEISPDLPSRSARKAWHKTHKENTVTEQNHEEEAADQPTEQERDADLVNDEEVSREKGGLRDVTKGTALIKGYPPKDKLAAYFFGAIVRRGVRPVTEQELGVELVAAPALTVAVEGIQEDVEAVQEIFRALYDVLPGELAKYRTENKEYLGLKDLDDPKERHRQSYVLRETFCAEFAMGFAAEYLEVASKYAGGVGFQMGVAAVEGYFEDPSDLI